MAQRVGTNIEIQGVKQTVRALKAFTPAVHRALNKEIKRSLEIVKQRALARYPKGEYNVRVNTKNLLGTVVAASGGAGGGWKRWDDAPGGVRAAIFEFAGSQGDGATPQAQGLIESLSRRYGQPGRFLWAAWDESGKQVLAEIKAAVLRAERDLQATLDLAGEDY